MIAFLLFSLVILLFFNDGLCQDSFQWGVTYTITLHEDGSATVAIEKRTLLKDKNETSYFELYYISESRERLQKFSGNISALIDLVFKETGRKCSRSSVNYFAGTSSAENGTYGIVRYMFDWTEFAEKTNETTIIVGDVFVEGFFLLGDGVLKVKYPSNYVVSRIIPPANNNETEVLIWVSTANLDKKQPKIVLERKKPTLLDYLHENIFLILSVILISSLGLTVFMGYRAKRRRVKAYKLTVQDGERESFDELSDERRVVELLKAAGGILTQSKITEKLGCSKAKVSQLLTLMENKGILKRKKRGREKIVALIDDRKLDEKTKS